MSILESSSTITSKGQTTIPNAVRKALNLAEGDKLNFRILESGRVELVKDSSIRPEDSVIAAYLSFLEQDLIQRPSKLSVLQRDPQLSRHLQDVEIEGWLEDNRK